MAHDRKTEIREELQRVRDAIASAGTDRHSAAFDLEESKDDSSHAAAATRFSKAQHDLDQLRARAERLAQELANG